MKYTDPSDLQIFCITLDIVRHFHYECNKQCGLKNEIKRNQADIANEHDANMQANE